MRADRETAPGLSTVLRAASTLMTRLRVRQGKAAPPKYGVRVSRTTASTGERSISLSGELIRGSTHSVTSVADAVRQLDSGARRATAAFSAMHISPYLLVEHFGPGMARVDADVYPRCGMECLLYVVQGGVTHRNSALADALRVEGTQALLLTAAQGVATCEIPDAEPVEMMTIWVNLPRDARHCVPDTQISYQLPEYVACDEGTGREIGRVRVVLGDGVPLLRGKCVGDAVKILRPKMGDAGVYDVMVGENGSVRLCVQSRRVLMYVREGTVRIGGRVVGMGSLAVLHGPGAGCVVLESEGDQCCKCIVMEGEAIEERVEWTPAGFAAASEREIRKNVKRYTKGAMGTVRDEL